MSPICSGSTITKPKQKLPMPGEPVNEEQAKKERKALKKVKLRSFTATPPSIAAFGQSTLQFIRTFQLKAAGEFLSRRLPEVPASENGLYVYLTRIPDEPRGFYGQTVVPRLRTASGQAAI